MARAKCTQSATEGCLKGLGSLHRSSLATALVACKQTSHPSVDVHYKQQKEVEKNDSQTEGAQ